MSQLMGWIYSCEKGELIWRDPVQCLPDQLAGLQDVDDLDFILFTKGEEVKPITAGTFRRLVQVVQEHGPLKDDDTVRALQASGCLDPRYSALLDASRWLQTRLDLTTVEVR
ncbi:hypothetical protein [Pantoea vagans]|uniref:hypothetical protein n=1 Tax=Pantoea vagans TaxID=470934 RepID=UPI00289B159F|nr:hypothetical protein [Pantoea vagans]